MQDGVTTTEYRGHFIQEEIYTDTYGKQKVDVIIYKRLHPAQFVKRVASVKAAKDFLDANQS
jgi:hypothetical protein